MLMLAAIRGQLTHVDLLLRAGALPDLRQTQQASESGDTALLRAFYGGHLAVAQRLALDCAELADRQALARNIQIAHANGARLRQACEMTGRWPCAPRPAPP